MSKFIALFFIFMAVRASAIVVQDYTTTETAPAALDWSHVYNYKGSSAVAVDTYWILTAKHVADDGWANGFSAEGITYFPQEVAYHASADLALVRVDKDLPGFYDLYTGYIPQRLADPKLSVLTVGYGTTGSVFDDYWTYGSSGRNIRRWGSQEIDKSDESFKQGGTETHVFWMYFDLADTDYEAGTGPGDSGGGVFYEEDGKWKLAGINIAIAANSSGFDRTFSAAIPEYADWIQTVIPEPGVISLMSLSAIGLLFTRGLNREKQRVRIPPSSSRRIPLCDLYGAQVAVAGKNRRGDLFNGLPGQLQKLQSGLMASTGFIHRRIQVIDDTFFELVHVLLERMHEKKADIAYRVNMAAKNALDLFLEKAGWDQIVDGYRQIKKTISANLRKGK